YLCVFRSPASCPRHQEMTPWQRGCKPAGWRVIGLGIRLEKDDERLALDQRRPLCCVHAINFGDKVLIRLRVELSLHSFHEFPRHLIPAEAPGGISYKVRVEIDSEYSLLDFRERERCARCRVLDDEPSDARRLRRSQFETNLRRLAHADQVKVVEV